MTYQTDFGPTVKSIRQTWLDIDTWLSQQPTGYVDYDGAHVELDWTDEQAYAVQRMNQMEELLNLRKPVYHVWEFEIAAGACYAAYWAERAEAN